MKRISVRLTSAATILLSSCTSVHIATMDINDRARGSTATVYLDSIDSFGDNAIKVIDLSVRTDSATWIDPETHSLVAVPRSRLAAVDITSSGKGAIDGMMVGASVGAALFGSVTFGAAGDGKGWHPSSGEKVGATFAGATLGALIGLVPGVIVGGIAGGRDRYVFAAPVVDSALTKGGVTEPSH